MSPELFRRFQSEVDLKPGHRHWIGNDANGRHHHGMIPVEELTVDIHLEWKADAAARPQEVGCYRLQIPVLLAARFVRTDGPGHVRLRFVHAEDGNVYIQTRANQPRLVVGKVE